MSKRSKILKSDLKRAIQQTGGNISRVAEAFQVTRQTIYNRIDHYELHDELNQWRRTIHDMAYGNVFDAVSEGDVDLSRFVLTHYPGGPRWSSRSDVTVQGWGDEHMALMQQLGIEPSQASDDFLEMLREAARQQAVTDA